MCYNTRARGCSSMAERQLPKLNTRVRFPSPAPASAQSPLGFVSGNSLRLLPKTAFAPLRLLPNPKHFGFGFVFSFARKVRSTSFPATACGYCRKLRSLPCASFQIRSTRLRICFFFCAQSPLGFVSGNSLRLLPKTAFAPLRLLPSPKHFGFGFVFFFCELRFVRDGVFSFRINAISHSLRHSSFPN